MDSSIKEKLMRILFFRHAPTKGNLLKQYIGSTDEPLSPQGIRLASQMKPMDRATQVYTSGLQRTQQTASIIFPNASILPVPRLNEMDFGIFDGKSYLDMEQNTAYREWVDANCEPRCPGGEDKEGFTKRCVSAFSGIMQEAPVMNPDGEMFFVLHDGTLKALLSELALPKKAYFEWNTPFCGGYRFNIQENSSLKIGTNAFILTLEEILPPPSLH